MRVVRYITDYSELAWMTQTAPFRLTSRAAIGIYHINNRYLARTCYALAAAI